jgi:hypothetical protein
MRLTKVKLHHGDVSQYLNQNEDISIFTIT